MSAPSKSALANVERALRGSTAEPSYRGALIDRQDLAGSGGACFSADGKHRVLLWRACGGGGPSIAWCMLNPSRANELDDDPTVRRCIGFARREQARKLSVVNLFSLIASSPTELRAAGRRGDTVSLPTWNDVKLQREARAVNWMVVAWGNLPESWMRMRAKHVLNVLWEYTRGGMRLLCLGKTRSGQPRHPLYVRGDRAFEDYRGT